MAFVAPCCSPSSFRLRSSFITAYPSISPSSLSSLQRPSVLTARNNHAAFISMSAPATSSSAATPTPSPGGGVTRATDADTPQKQFLERLKSLGRVRLVVRNPVGILETVGTFDSLFYAKIPSGEYANLIDHNLNLDMHILLSGLVGARFEIGKARGSPPSPTFAVRLLGPGKEDVAVSVFVMWDKRPDDVEPERIQAWKDLKSKYAKVASKEGEEEADMFYFADV